MRRLKPNPSCQHQAAHSRGPGNTGPLAFQGYEYSGSNRATDSIRPRQRSGILPHRFQCRFAKPPLLIRPESTCAHFDSALLKARNQGIALVDRSLIRPESIHPAKWLGDFESTDETWPLGHRFVREQPVDRLIRPESIQRIHFPGEGAAMT